MDVPIIVPRLLSLLATYQCSAKCKNCCFQCSPQIKQRLSLEEMKSYIDQSIDFCKDQLTVLVLTGGECFLLKDDLVKIVKYAHSKGLLVRVVTNGFWARTYSEAYDRLKELVDVGLTEINFSTGDDHQKWIPYSSIVNGCIAAIDLGLTCLVNVETHDKASFNCKRFFLDEQLKDYFNPKKHKNPLLVNNSLWMPVAKGEKSIKYKTIMFDPKEERRCTSLFTSLSINAYSQMIACCGLTSEYNPFLRLGSLKRHSVGELYKNQFQDFIKIWLFVEGPDSILKFVYQKLKIDKEVETKHICESCAEIFKNEQYIVCLRENYLEVMPTIMFKYSFLKQELS